MIASAEIEIANLVSFVKKGDDSQSVDFIARR